jgi:hypothetical protein
MGESGMNLREAVNEYLRSCDDWREHREWTGTYRQWEDLRASTGEAFLSTDLAAVRQMTYEAQAAHVA